MMKRTVIGLIAVFFAFGTFAILTRTVDSQMAAKPTATPTPTPIPEEDQIVRVDTELVNVDVRVIDRFSRPINGLQQSEFKVFEDGVQQKIDFFSRSEVPTNYTLVIDNSGSLRSQIEQVIEASKILVKANRPADETSVIRFISSEKIEILQDFTSNQTDLIDALEGQYIEGGSTAIIDAVYLAAEKVTSYEKSERSVDRKRRALVLVSDGEDVTSFYTQQQLFERLKETEVQIYVVGFIKDLSTERGFITKSKQSKAKSFLEKLASETGGRAYFPNTTGELNGIAQEIAAELRMQYSIGYIPTNDRKDGTFRNIKVTVSDGPNGQKRIPVTRAGRIAEKEGEPSTVQKATAKPNN